jgi:C1A family cysteine protease
MRGLGCKRDRHDPRDRHLGVLLGARANDPPPSAADLRNATVTAKDQGGTSSCTGQSTSQALRLAYLHAGIACPELSALTSYYWGRAESGEQKEDGGSYLRDVIQATQRFGCADETAWPFLEANVNVGPGHSVYRSAFDRRGPKGYYRVQPDPDSVRRAIAAGYPVVGGWQVSQAFLDWDGQEPIGMQLDNIVGGHALPICGYDPGGFWLLNSWGTGWGRDGGYALVNDAFIRQGDDLWAIDLRAGQ